MVSDIDKYDLSLALHWILEGRNLLRRQIDACQHGKVVRQVATMKELREMCQNGVTLDDLRRLYGVNATLEDLELVMPSPLIGDLGILPCSEEEIKGLSESEEESEDVGEEEWDQSEDVGEEEWDQSEDVGEEEMRASQDAREEEVSPSEDAGEEEVRASQDASEEEISPSKDVEEEEVRASQGAGEEEISSSKDMEEEEVRASQDAGEEEISPSQVEKSKALPLLSSMDQQAAREIEPQVPSFYDPLLALCLLSQSSNMLDVLMSLEILSRLT